MDLPEACVVRITDEQGETLGTGFLLSAEGLVATCRHLVEGRQVRVAFPGEEPRPARLLAKDPVHDVALLQIEGKLPPQARPARLGPSAEAHGRPFRSLGYRPLGGWEGIPAEGKVLGAVLEAPGRPEIRYLPLILQSQHLRGGMSGAPVYAPGLDRVVGIVTARWDALAAQTGFADRDTGFATPSEAVAALSGLPLHPSEPAFPAGGRGIAAEKVGRSILITGDHNIVYQYILQHYPSLKDDVVDFSGDIAEHTGRFVGRGWFFQEWLEPFLKSNPRGYLRIVADAGLGKTALAAEVARRYHTPAFFLNAGRGLVRTERCLRHLCAEVIGRYGLPYDHLPPRAGEDASFLVQLLEEAARIRQGGPLLLVIDGLDEADPVPPGRNWLLLPDRLPPGVYILLTQRPGDYTLYTEPRTPVEERELCWDAPDQQRDIADFLRREAGREKIGRALGGASPPIPTERFVQAMQSASEGNFMYLSYVLADIARREPGFDPLRLEELPRGLQGYYELFWARMEKVRGEEGWEEWERHYRPALALLGAAREPVTAGWLAAQMEWEADRVQERVLERWRRFLRRERHAGEETWSVVHRSFADFLAGKVDLAGAHRRIAEYYIRQAGGDWGRLAEVDGGYGLRHLGAHLAAGGKWEELYELVALGKEKQPWAEARHAAEGNYAGYLADLDLSWRRAEEEGKDAPAALGRQARCALIESSIHSLAGNIPPELLVAAVEKKVWEPQTALAYARQVADPGQRVQALAGLAPHLPPDLKEEALREALAAARELGDEDARAEALAGLAPRWAEWAGRERAAAYALWPETLRRLAARPRPHLLSDLSALSPVLSALGGAEAVGEAFRAIQDVGRWWP